MGEVEELLYVPTDNISTMDDFDLGFITALIEGEGEVNISYVSNKGKDGKVYRYVLTPRISISNASESLINKARAILDVGIIRHKTKQKYKMLHQLEILGYKDALKVCKIVEPYAISKKRQFQILQSFIESRINRTKGYKGKFPYLSKPAYSIEELDMFKAIKQENDYRGKGYGRWQEIYTFKANQIKGEDRRV